mmetsp:Transcript_38130/g.117650  ORF Transcript_38130/g.117650 Transcript_38130/m.117650 type:complete len:209 (+) Transcript_38130:369-995(+)
MSSRPPGGRASCAVSASWTRSSRWSSWPSCGRRLQRSARSSAPRPRAPGQPRRRGRSSCGAWLSAPRGTLSSSASTSAGWRRVGRNWKPTSRASLRRCGSARPPFSVPLRRTPKSRRPRRRAPALRAPAHPWRSNGRPQMAQSAPMQSSSGSPPQAPRPPPPRPRCPSLSPGLGGGTARAWQHLPWRKPPSQATRPSCRHRPLTLWLP